MIDFFYTFGIGVAAMLMGIGFSIGPAYILSKTVLFQEDEPLADACFLWFVFLLFCIFTYLIGYVVLHS